MAKFDEGVSDVVEVVRMKGGFGGEVYHMGFIRYGEDVDRVEEASGVPCVAVARDGEVRLEG